MKDKYESNSEMQHRRYQMTPEERGRDAIDKMTPGVQEFETARQGREVSADEARRKVESIAYRSERRKDK